MFTPEAEAAAWRLAERHTRLMKEKKATDKKLKWRKKTITIKVPICPKCGCDMYIITDYETGIKGEYRCEKCGKRIINLATILGG